MSRHAGIAGAGLFGRILAFYLKENGWQVTLFDMDDRAGMESCGLAGAGMITPYAELEKAEPVIHRMGALSLDMWPELLAQLKEPVFFQRKGSLVVAHRQDMRDLEIFKRNVSAKLDDSGKMIEVSGPEIADLEPALGKRFSRGVFFPDEGHVEGWDLFPALEKYLTRHHVPWHRLEITQVLPGRIVTAEKSYSFDLAVDCRGLGAKEEVPNLRGVRGELIAVRAPDVALNRLVRLMHPRYPLYVVPRPDHIFLIGATTIESEDRGPITVRSALELLSAAYSLHSGFAEANIMNFSVNCRPALADNMPRIFHEPGLVRVNGLYRHGYLITPAVAVAVTDLLASGPGSVRFPELLVPKT